MTITEIKVEFRKTVSDGSYGNESASVTLVAQVQAGEDAKAAHAALAHHARQAVSDQLRASQNGHIVRAMETREERDARVQRENDEYESRERAREEMRRERQAMYDAPAAELAEAANDEEDQAATPF